MKNLKTIRKHKSTEEGFSLVMAAGFGLVMMMIGLTIVSRSIKDNSVSASQKINNRSLAAAESGVSAYLSLLKNKSLLAGMQFANNSWTTTTTDLLNPYTAADIGITQGWQNLVASDSKKGQYRLLSYVASGTAGQAILRVQGRVNQRGTGTAATEEISTGTTTVEAIIGVTSVTPPAPSQTGTFPGLWLTNGPNNNIASYNQSFQAHGLTTTANTSLLTFLPTLTISNPNQAFSQLSVGANNPQANMSDCLLTMPATSSFRNSVDLATRINNGERLFPVTTGSTPDVADSDGIYRYFSGTIAVNGNNSIQFKSSAKVIVYLQGDLMPGGNLDITCDLSNCDAPSDLNDLVIYGYKSNGQLEINGNSTVKAFIIAPGYSASVKGGGNGQGYKGVLWARNWSEGSGGSNSNKLVVNQKDTTRNLTCPYTNTIQVINQSAVPST